MFLLQEISKIPVNVSTLCQDLFIELQVSVRTLWQGVASFAYFLPVSLIFMEVWCFISSSLLMRCLTLVAHIIKTPQLHLYLRE